jgi:hypothetical protein
MKRKVRKYVEGGYGDVSSEDYGMGSQEEMIERNIKENERRRMMEGPTQAAPIRSPEIIKATNVEEFQEPGTAGFSRTSVTKAPAKAPIVTKEQMKKAGFDNLRDYMNAQKGLTRRSEAPKPAKTPAAKPAKSEGPSMSSYKPDARAGRSTNVSYLRKDKLGMEPDMYIARRRMKEGFKAGGKVGTASRRADGIATKGKTRGRYI